MNGFDHTHHGVFIHHCRCQAVAVVHALLKTTALSFLDASAEFIGDRCSFIPTRLTRQSQETISRHQGKTDIHDLSEVVPFFSFISFIHNLLSFSHNVLVLNMSVGQGMKGVDLTCPFFPSIICCHCQWARAVVLKQPLCFSRP